MRAILLSAGYGTRLAPLTDKIPKCLAPIKGQPLLGYWLDLLLPLHIEKVLINTHYLPQMVESYVKTHKYAALITTVFEKTLLGTA